MKGQLRKVRYKVVPGMCKTLEGKQRVWLYFLNWPIDTLTQRYVWPYVKQWASYLNGV